MPIEEIQKIHQVARANDIKMHMDGARLWNASQETDTPLSEYGKCFDTVSICLSKGVGAPIGSMLVGSKELIKRARHIRKLMGGGWRQAGMLAVAARHCINTIVPTMKDTHALARKLASHLESLGVQLLVPVDTNMIFIDTAAAGFNIAELAEALKAKNIKIFSSEGTTCRIVFHYQITEEAIDNFSQVANELAATKKKSGFVPPVTTIKKSIDNAYPTSVTH
jgi:threonine aldolase